MLAIFGRPQISESRRLHISCPAATDEEHLAAPAGNACHWGIVDGWSIGNESALSEIGRPQRALRIVEPAFRAFEANAAKLVPDKKSQGVSGTKSESVPERSASSGRGNWAMLVAFTSIESRHSPRPWSSSYHCCSLYRN